jgi:hypothetical protein
VGPQLRDRHLPAREAEEPGQIPALIKSRKLSAQGRSSRCTRRSA